MRARTAYSTPLHRAFPLTVAIRAIGAQSSYRPFEPLERQRAVTPDTALRLARYFDSSAEFWMNLQSAYDLRKAELESAVQIRREVGPLKEAA